LAQSDYERALELLMQSSELLSADEADQVMLWERCFIYIDIADLLKEKGLLVESIDFKQKVYH
jgi:hypothetical protein